MHPLFFGFPSHFIGWLRLALSFRVYVPVHFSSVAQSCLTLCDPMDCNMPGFPAVHHLLELAQTHVHWVVMPSNHLILSCPLLLLPWIVPSIKVFFNESTLHIRWPKYWSFSFRISLPIECSSLLYFRIDWLALLAVLGTLKSLLQHHSSKTSVFWRSAFFMVQLSHPYMITGKTISLTRRIFVGKVMSLLFNMLFRVVLAFLLRSKCLNFIAGVTTCSDLGAKENSLSLFALFPHLFAMKWTGLDAMILVFWILSFKPSFSFSSRGFLVPLHFLP